MWRSSSCCFLNFPLQKEQRKPLVCGWMGSSGAEVAWGEVVACDWPSVREFVKNEGWEWTVWGFRSWLMLVGCGWLDRPFRVCLSLSIALSSSSWSSLFSSRIRPRPLPSIPCLWVRRCIFRLPFWAALWSQYGHLKGFSPVCVRMWRERMLLKRKRLPHNGHGYFLFLRLSSGVEFTCEMMLWLVTLKNWESSALPFILLRILASIIWLARSAIWLLIGWTGRVIKLSFEGLAAVTEWWSRESKWNSPKVAAECWLRAYLVATGCGFMLLRWKASLT